MLIPSLRNIKTTAGRTDVDWLNVIKRRSAVEPNTSRAKFCFINTSPWSVGWERSIIRDLSAEGKGPNDIELTNHFFSRHIQQFMQSTSKIK